MLMDGKIQYGKDDIVLNYRFNVVPAKNPDTFF